MKKNFFKMFLFFVFIIYSYDAYTQSDSLYIDSLRRVLTTQREDSNSVNTMTELSNLLRYKNDYKSSINYAEGAISLSKKINFKYGEAENLFSLGMSYFGIDNEVKAYDCLQEALDIFKNIGDDEGTLKSLTAYSSIYGKQKKFRKELDLELEAEKICLKLSDSGRLGMVRGNIGAIYSQFGKLDSAETYVRNAYELSLNPKNNLSAAFESGSLGQILLDEEKYEEASSFLHLSIALSQQENNLFIIGHVYGSLAKLKLRINDWDSAFFYANKSLAGCEHGTDCLTVIMEANNLISQFYEHKQDYQEALRFYKLSSDAKDSVLNQEKIQKLSGLVFQEKEKEQEIINTKKEFQNKLILYMTLGVLFLIALVAIFLYRSNKHQKKANIKIEKAYAELKSAQAQLIQSEKMASLGELTAGIAHEIQNPLNFVNNFSEVNTELLAEMKDELDKGNTEDAKAIANDVIENEQKINHHGKRAGDIVKGMLQHSRTSTGVKEPTDINALADEYLRLSYHGLRAKDKEFNATLKTNFDETIEKINIIPQDIGRVLLNLFNNAFYAVSERKKLNISGYEPTVSVSTKELDGRVEICVKDNGNGIPQNIVDKIFQPFFTTKPTGEGTGLGLSLSYDIIKAHGGEIKVETNQEESTEFIILLPVT